MPRKSPVWEFFSSLLSDSTIAACLVCDKKVSRGSHRNNLSTTPLLNHLKQHPEEYEKVIGSRKQSKAPCSTPTTSVTLKTQIQPTIDQFNKSRQPWGAGEAVWKANTRRLVEMIAVDLEPLSVIGQPGFNLGVLTKTGLGNTPGVFTSGFLEKFINVPNVESPETLTVSTSFQPVIETIIHVSLYDVDIEQHQL
ncbi:hypothetical protein CAPTEDRAFT_193575 [Capitella teleta]|uniref:BED-type domain-containing protein n=1 Tax=Capitella teleta TaxID=283909 RepID=R7UHQ7_CAPTE|nr:hypothetical protein CAPTEDRAFT_193575 [Capitella teleta]|eukprot:ELU06059.1 hypothetical protein CAPTEDRAFT_193575 [Capitella teleta]